MCVQLVTDSKNIIMMKGAITLNNIRLEQRCILYDVSSVMHYSVVSFRPVFKNLSLLWANKCFGSLYVVLFEILLFSLYLLLFVIICDH